VVSCYFGGLTLDETAGPGFSYGQWNGRRRGPALTGWADDPRSPHDAERWQRVKAPFHAALGGLGRRRLLGEACGDDARHFPPYRL
jgi:hypothetical protein